MEFTQQLWLALVMAWYLQACAEAGTVPRQNAFVELDSQLLDRIEITTEEIAKNSTREFVDHEIQAMIDLFINNLNITINELHQYSSHRNSSDFDDTQMKEFQNKGLIMYENTAITVDYIIYKISVLSKSSEELEQLEKYIIDEEKRLKDVSLQKKIKSVLDKIQTTKRFIEKHVNHLKDFNNVLNDLSVKLMATLKVSNNYKLYRFVSQLREIN